MRNPERQPSLQDIGRTTPRSRENDIVEILGESDVVEIIEGDEPGEDKMLKANEIRNAVIEIETTEHGEYSAQLGDGGKEKQQDSLAIFKTENETWLVVADGVSTSHDGGTASSELIKIVQHKIQKGIHPREAMAEASRQFSHKIELDLAKREAQRTVDRKIGPMPVDLLSTNPKENPLLSTTFVAAKLNIDKTASAFLLGDGQVYLSRAEKRGGEEGSIEKIQNGEMKPVDFTDEEKKYFNDMDLQLRSVLENSVQGSIDLLKLYSEGKIQLTGRMAPLGELFEKARVGLPDGTSVIDKSKLPASTQNFLERFAKPPEQQAQALKEINLGELKPGDIVLVCSDGVENDILSSKIHEIIKENTVDGKPDANAIREAIIEEVRQTIDEGTKKYSKQDNFSLIVYVQTERGTEKVAVTKKDVSTNGTAEDEIPDFSEDIQMEGEETPPDFSDEDINNALDALQ